jgi:hypothetical protein
MRNSTHIGPFLKVGVLSGRLPLAVSLIILLLISFLLILGN